MVKSYIIGNFAYNFKSYDRSERIGGKFMKKDNVSYDFIKYYGTDTPVENDKKQALINLFMSETNEIMVIKHYIVRVMINEYVIKNCVPPIVGEITKQEFDNRGISLIQDENGSLYFSQKGRRISPIITIDNEIID